MVERDYLLHQLRQDLIALRECVQLRAVLYSRADRADKGSLIPSENAEWKVEFAKARRELDVSAVAEDLLVDHLESVVNKLVKLF